jgi:hypothetical protein
MGASNGKKPTPLLTPIVAGVICPHCGKRSYSAAGVHPQCSQTFASNKLSPAKKK